MWEDTIDWGSKVSWEVEYFSISQFLAVFAFKIVYLVVNVLDITIKRVVSWFNASKFCNASNGSTFAINFKVLLPKEDAYLAS